MDAGAAFLLGWMALFIVGYYLNDRSFFDAIARGKPAAVASK